MERLCATNGPRDRPWPGLGEAVTFLGASGGARRRSRSGVVVLACGHPAQDAALPPRKHLVRYHGFYSSAARGKRRGRQDTELQPETTDAQAASPPDTAAARKRWADLLRRVYEVDPMVCPRCAGTMRVVGFITQPHVFRRILDHLRQAHKVRPRPPPPHEPQPSAPL